MRLIDADAAKKALVGWETDPTDEEIERAIDHISTIEAKPVRHGEWEACGIGLTCKICHKGLVLEQGDVEMNYCPNCGAKMDGGKQDAQY